MEEDGVKAAAGVYDPVTDTVHLYAVHIKTAKEAGTTVLSHELTHKGLAALGKEVAKLLNAVAIGHLAELTRQIKHHSPRMNRQQVHDMMDQADRVIDLLLAEYRDHMAEAAAGVQELAAASNYWKQHYVCLSAEIVANKAGFCGCC